jgi:hypothetical protein
LFCATKRKNCHFSRAFCDSCKRSQLWQLVPALASGGTAWSTQVLSERVVLGGLQHEPCFASDRRLELRSAVLSAPARLLWGRCQSGGLSSLRREALAQQYYFQAKIDYRCPRSRARGLPPSCIECQHTIR